MSRFLATLVKKIPESHAREKDTAPNQRTDVTQDNAELINDGGRGGLAHILNVPWGNKFCKTSPGILTLSLVLGSGLNSFLQYGHRFKANFHHLALSSDDNIQEQDLSLLIISVVKCGGRERVTGRINVGGNLSEQKGGNLSERYRYRKYG